MGEFGEKFRKTREKKELSLDDISSVIKVSPRMLRAIEEENFDQLPGGVFNKGFIRSYAKHLGLDPEEVISEYLANIREAQLAAQQKWQEENQPAPSPSASRKNQNRTNQKKIDSIAGPKAAPSPSLQVQELPELHLPRSGDVRTGSKFAAGSLEIPWGLMIVGAVVVILAIFLWTRHSRTVRSESAKAAVQSPIPATTGASTAGNRATSTPSNPAPSPTSQPPQTPASTTSSAAEPEEKNDVTIRNFGAPLPKSAPPTTGSLTLVIRAEENSWISVTADGQPVTEETLIAPAHTTVHASKEFVVKVGNAGGVSFLVNGKEIPAQGAESEVKTLTFDASGIKSSP